MGVVNLRDAGGFQGDFGGISPVHSFHTRHHLSEKIKASGFSAESLLGGLEDLRLGSRHRKTLQDIAKTKDSQVFFEEWLHFGLRQEQSGNLVLAARVYGKIAETQAKNLGTPGTIDPSALANIKARAKNNLDKLHGRGSLGARLEFLLPRLAEDATDYRIIAPMIGASLVYRLTRAATLGRYARSLQPTWYNRGLPARLSASALGFAAEVPTFTLASRGLYDLSGAKVGWDAQSLGRDLLGATLALGTLKTFAFGGHRLFNKVHGITELASAAQVGRFSQFSRWAVPQFSAFTGLMAAYKLEEKLGLRPKGDNGTLVLNSLSTLLALGIGSHLAHRALGPSFAKYQTELDLRTHLDGNLVQRSRPAPHTENTAPSFLVPALARPGGKRNGNFSIHRSSSQQAGSRDIKSWWQKIIRPSKTSADSKKGAPRSIFGAPLPLGLGMSLPTALLFALFALGCGCPPTRRDPETDEPTSSPEAPTPGGVEDLDGDRSGATQRPRARDLGIPFDGKPGPANAITDVAGIEVGHRTIIEGKGPLVVGKGPVRTGVTVVFPRGKRSSDPVYGGWYALNGNGEMTGTTWLTESGVLNGPVVLTNTHSVGVARDSTIAWWVRNFKPTGLQEDAWSLPVVAETWDGYLNDINGFHVKPKDVFAALDAAAPGPVAEGSVGGGTGMICHEWKGGIGTASRTIRTDLGEFVVGVLVQCNYGLASQLRIAGVPMGAALSKKPPPATPGTKTGKPTKNGPTGEHGSIIAVVATDAPLLPHQLERLARRVPLALGRMGAIGGNSSGDIFIAFSTANAGTREDKISTIRVLPNDQMSWLFEGTVQATEEAIVNALVAGKTMTGVNDRRVEGLPRERVRKILRQHSRLVEP